MSSATHFTTPAIVPAGRTSVIEGPLSYIMCSSFDVGDVCLFIDDVTINDSLRPGDTQCRGELPSRTHHTVSLFFINVITTTVQVHNLNDDCTDRVTTLLACYVRLLLPCFSR